MTVVGWISGCDIGPIPPDVETIATGLNNPVGLAMTSDGTLLVAESGAGRIVSIAADGTMMPFITDFALGTFFPYDIGPLSMVIQEGGAIIVGEGGRPIGMERVSFFDSAGQPLDEPPLTPISGGNFQGMAVDPVSGDLFIASANTNRLYRAAVLDGGMFDAPVDFVVNTLAEPIGRAAPAALVFDTDGVLWVGFSDFVNGGIDRLTIAEGDEPPAVESVYDAAGRMVTALAVRPSDGAVLFAEFHPERPAEARVGRFRDDGTIATYAEELTAPAGLAFGADDALYVSTLGETPNADRGSVLKLTLETPPPAEMDDAVADDGMGESTVSP
ncbi:MAG: hypothetical protein HOP29_07005 [Phycisphaerales bacterium]|nr:hypothetical protein [Phycisphaerales bacterium]